MIINNYNYEIWFIEFFEGNLNPEEEKELFGFLGKNPGKKKEFEIFRSRFSNTVQASYIQKHSLKKEIHDLGPVNDQTIDEYSIAYLEDDLDEKEKTSLMVAIHENAEYLKTFTLYQYTKLLPDMGVVYKYKSRLKHFVLERRRIAHVLGYFSAAVLLTFTIFFFVHNNNDNKQDPAISETIKNKGPINQALNTPGIASINSLNTGGPEKARKHGISTKNEQLPQQDSPVENAYPPVQENTMNMNKSYEHDALKLLARIEPKKINRIEYKGQPFSMDIKASFRLTGTRVGDEPGMTTLLNQSSEGKITFWKIAEIGINGFNKLNETNYMLQKNFNASGELISVSLITSERVITTSAI